MFDFVSRACKKLSNKAENLKRFISFSAFSTASLEVPDLWAFLKSFFSCYNGSLDFEILTLPLMLQKRDLMLIYMLILLRNRGKPSIKSGRNFTMKLSNLNVQILWSLTGFLFKKTLIFLIKMKGISKSFFLPSLKNSSSSATCFQAFSTTFCPFTPSCSCHKDRGIPSRYQIPSGSYEIASPIQIDLAKFICESTNHKVDILVWRFQNITI